MIRQGDIVSHNEMCAQEGMSLQRGMNFRPKGGMSILLMSQRPGAPYEDEVIEDGRVLLYEGHDVAKTAGVSDPKKLDQPLVDDRGKPTPNGRFLKAAQDYAVKAGNAEIVKVYEKIKTGIWVFNGYFRLVDAWVQKGSVRSVVRFRLELMDQPGEIPTEQPEALPHTRLIPPSTKLEVWRRDKGACVKCGSTDNLHFDHVIPFSKGGSSMDARNIQLLCGRHNLEKRDKIE